MKAIFIAILLGLIATAAAASAEERVEIAPILILNSGSKNPIESNDIQIEPEPTPAITKSEDPKPEEPILTASAADPNMARAQASSTRKMVEDALKDSGPRFICRGVGPFWILKIGDKNIEFDLVGEKFLQFTTPASSASLNSASMVTNFSSKADNGAEINALIVDSQATGAQCTDGMSDQVYSHSVFVNQGGKIYDGCCWMEK